MIRYEPNKIFSFCVRVLAQTRKQRRHLQQRVHSVDDFHVRLANLADKQEFELLVHRHALADAEQVADDVLGGVTQAPKLLHDFVRVVDVAVDAMLQHVLNQQRMRLVAHFEDVVADDPSKSIRSRLEIVERLPHVALSSEHDRFQAVLGVVEILLLAHEDALGEHLGVGELRETDHRASRLDRLDDLLACVAGEGEAGCAAVDFHRTAESLLRSFRHRIRFIKDHNLVPTARQRHLLLRKHFDLVPDDIDAAFIRSVQLQHGVLEVLAEEDASEAENRCRLSNTRWTGDDDVRSVSLCGKHGQSRNCFFVACK